ncbi:MAG: hypothetical protein ACK42G_09730, partial [Candidatus Kapaibacteriota bacterium]
MFYRFVFAFIIGIFVLSTSSFAGDVKLKTHSDSASYSVGYNVGKSVLNQVKFDSLDLNFSIILSGFTDGILQKQPQI